MTAYTKVRVFAALTLAGMVLCACSAAGSSESGDGTRDAAERAASAAGQSLPVSDPDPPGRSSTTRASIERDIAIARQHYYNEVHGERVHQDLQLVANDRALVELLAQGRYPAAQALAHRLMTGNPLLHITRISFVRGGRERIDATWNHNGSFVSAPLARTLGLHGHALGTLLVSVQDIVGYVKLVTRYTPAQAVAKGASGQIRASLPALENVSLPSSGRVTVAGVTYLVGSFRAYSWGRTPEREPLTVWVLEPA